jgi:hypothetical protein
VVRWSGHGAGEARIVSAVEAPQPLELDPTERVELLFRDLRSSPSGSSEREAARRLAQFGPNDRASLRSIGVFGNRLLLCRWVVRRREVRR